ncbi:MAG: GIY-YIG catalytic domain protein [Candidatus Jorgensenbacteria bacterium GW2011_GWA1_48_13]|uniref:GIY-YIG catalytic domain protein n=1 Tax=Candidatus Jorgensenbacteria bacterium GW2011_GWB1_50_10 TaxID=1618665 RepID=A0A0G1Z783_9BACT|nr:MAG: GIY-YIG catalytic domain protein [Candidatus Jorgensenbacteria bacterium GW2011_GWA1_48_13]KKW14789.1 MAG: GIY-YIG catalytic domain protein [Candidatus Jorgensenbacteria bacterium GW2011_GWB1_50_10]
MVFFYTYILMSNRDGYSYIGYSQDLKKRIEEHNKGYVLATKHRRPLKLVYYEACLNREDAMQRERYLKTTNGRRWLGKRLRRYNKSV